MSYLYSLIILIGFSSLMVTDAYAQMNGMKKLHHPEIRDILASGKPQDLIILFDDTDIQETAATMRKKRGAVHETPEILLTKSSMYKALKKKVLNVLPIEEAETIKDYSHLPMMFLKVKSLKGLSKLIEHPSVVRVYIPQVRKRLLNESLPLINQPPVKAMGILGTGTTVAVLDSGVDYTLPAFGSCTAPNTPSGCKVVYAHDFAPDDGYLDDSEQHGTNVSGIVLGVAPDTRIIALDVFGHSDGANDQDIIDAINWCIANQAAYNIVAMNLSLGSGFYNAPCPSSVFASPISNARSAGILASIASGNEYYTDGIGEPACVPAAISVGAVYDGGSGTPGADIVADFSNSAYFLTMLAPGEEIIAAGIPKFGTSMAAPHVAGAIAVLRGDGAYPTETVDEIVSRLTDTGEPVLDHRNGITKPRLNLLAAYYLKNILRNAGFEKGRVNWIEYSSGNYDIITQDPSLSHSGNWLAWMGGYNSAAEYVYQDITIPSDAIAAGLRFWYWIYTEEFSSNVYDTMKVQILRPSDNALLVSLQTLSNLDATSEWVLSSLYDLSSFKGQTIRLRFIVNTDRSFPTDFLIDDISLLVKKGEKSLSVAKSGTGRGTVTSSPAGINCGSNCSKSYASGASVTLTATPATGSVFAGWSGGGCSGTSTCTVTMNAAKTVTATFNLIRRTLTVTKSGTGTGNVTAGANCTLNWVGNTGTCTVNNGTTITLSGTAGAGSTFEGWSNSTGSAAGCAGTGNCIFNITSDSSITATFTTAVSLLSPNGGEVIPSDSTHTIEWQASTNAHHFTLRLSMDNGMTWSTIASNVTGNSYGWRVPIPANNKRKCLIRVIAFNASNVRLGADRSDATFTIEVVKLNTPNGEENLRSGNTYDITWTTNATRSEVNKVELYYTMNATAIPIVWKPIGTITGNPGTHPWTVPTVTSSRTKCRVRLVLKDSAGNTIGSDVSDGYFTISP